MLWVTVHLLYEVILYKSYIILYVYYFVNYKMKARLNNDYINAVEESSSLHESAVN